MKQRAKVIGSLLSPYVRKVLACLDLKGVPYEIDPIVPFFGDDRCSQLSPVRRIPVLVDEQVEGMDCSPHTKGLMATLLKSLQMNISPIRESANSSSQRARARSAIFEG